MSFAGDPGITPAWAPPELEGAPAILAEAREELLALKAGTVFVCARPDGEIWPGDISGEGLYAHDTRHLSELRLTVGGLPPVVLSSTMESGHHAVVNATNPELRVHNGVVVPQETLSVRRTLLVGYRLHYEIRLRSFARNPITTIVALSLAADFVDVFEVRGAGRRTTGHVLPAAHDGDEIRFAYVAADGERRETFVGLNPFPSEIRLDGERALVAWEVNLDPGEATSLQLTAEPLGGGGGGGGGGSPPRRRMQQAAHDLDAESREWVAACASITSDNDFFDRLIEASVRDLHALMMPLDGEALPAAGIPWYVAPFGRDSLLTATETLMVNPEVARGTLLTLARRQATADEPWRDAEPGKILHELRTGELARTGRIPHTPYYGTVDATPLFLMLAGDYYRWTLDLETMETLLPALDAALTWIDEWGDRDGDGFVEYERRSPAGLLNQGWKDSDDAVVHADGSRPVGPIALVEVQGYVYAARLRIAEVYAALGHSERAEHLRAQAARLRVAFNEVFWDPAENFLVMALDGAKAQVRSVGSNAGHCLYCEILDDDKAARVAERLLAPDMFTGWGIRTLSSDSPAYNPMSYHNGSVWPHDNAIAAAGLKRYGFNAAAARIATGLFDVASGTRDFRLPELLCGFGRDESKAIVAYPVACIPQAWAAAAPFLLVQALLGISASASENRLTVDRPHLPDWLGSLDIQDIRVAESRASLSFWRTGSDATGFSLREQHGDLQVTMSV